MMKILPNSIVLVIGFSKSGTSLTRAMLDGHSMLDSFRQEIAVTEKYTLDLLKKEVDEDLKRTTPGHYMLTRFADHFSMFEGQEKSPAWEWNSLYENIKFVVPIRNKLPWFNSYMRRFKGSNAPISRLKRLIGQIVEYNARVSGRNIFLHLYNEKSISFQYEELCLHPTITMKRIAKFLRIPYEPILERPTIFGKEIPNPQSRDNRNYLYIDAINDTSFLYTYEIKIIQSLARQ